MVRKLRKALLRRMHGRLLSEHNRMRNCLLYNTTMNEDERSKVYDIIGHLYNAMVDIKELVK